MTDVMPCVMLRMFLLFNQIWIPSYAYIMIIVVVDRLCALLQAQITVTTMVTRLSLELHVAALDDILSLLL